MGRSAPQTPRERLAERVASVPLVRLEALAVALLFVAAIVPRARDLGGRFDRGADGARGAELAIAAVNLERGAARGAFPLLNVRRPTDAEHELVLAHRSPLVPWTARLGARLFAPEGWAEDVVRGEAPEDLEFGMRLPFFAAHLLALVLLWAVAREAYGRQVALMTLALAAASPVGIHFAGLVGTESLALPATLLLVLLGLRFARRGAHTELVGSGILAALGATLSFAPLLFIPGLGALLWRRRGPRAAGAWCAVTAALGGAVFLARRSASIAAAEDSAMPELGDPFLVLWDGFTSAPDGLGPLGWIGAVAGNAVGASGAVIVAAALLAGLLRAARALSPVAAERLAALERPRRPEPDLPALGVLAAGALLVLLALRGWAAREESAELQLWWWPVLALGGALLVRQISGPLLALRVGTAPLVLVVLALALPGLGVHAAQRAQTRGDAAPVPMPHEVGAWLAAHTEPDDFTAYDRRLGMHPQLALYAWRTTWPTPPELVGPHPAASMIGVESADEYWLAPAPDTAAAGTAPLPVSFDGAVPRIEGERWALYAPPVATIEALLESPPSELPAEGR